MKQLERVEDFGRLKPTLSKAFNIFQLKNSRELFRADSDPVRVSIQPFFQIFTQFRPILEFIFELINDKQVESLN